MKFEEAIKELLKGNKITIRGGIYQPGWEEYKFDLCDIISDKWDIYNPGKSFLEVFEAFKKGKSIRRKSWDSFMITQKIDSYISSQDILENDWEIID